MIDLFNKLSYYYFRIKTLLLYRPFFGSIGSGTVIQSPILIANSQCIDIGKKVFIRKGARLEVVVAKSGINPKLHIGDYTNLEQNVHIACHKNIFIGNYVSITANCAIVDISHPIGDFVNSLCGSTNRFVEEDSFVEIGDYCVIGMGTVILPNVKIGKNSFVGANSVVTKDIPEYSIVAGAPARVLKKYNKATCIWEAV